MRASKVWQQFSAWLSDVHPVMARTANRRVLFLQDDIRVLEEKHSLAMSDLRKTHAAELELRTKKIESVLEKIATTRWHREPHGSYAVTVSMNPDVLGGVSMYRDDLTFLARMIARQVEAQIASGHFVQAAYQSEYESLPPLRRPHS